MGRRRPEWGWKSFLGVITLKINRFWPGKSGSDPKIRASWLCERDEPIRCSIVYAHTLLSHVILAPLPHWYWPRNYRSWVSKSNRAGNWELVPRHLFIVSPQIHWRLADLSAGWLARPKRRDRNRRDRTAGNQCNLSIPILIKSV